MPVFIINLSKKNQNTGYWFYINNIKKIKANTKIVSIDIITTKSFIQKLIIFSPLNIIFQFLSLSLKKKLNNRYNYILCTMPNYIYNIYLIRKKGIKTYLMIDSSFDYYSNHRYLFFFKYFSFLSEELLLISGLNSIILNSDYVAESFKKRHKYSLRNFKITILSLPIWFESNNSKQMMNNENSIVVYGNFLFKPNLEGLYFILNSHDISSSLNITFVGIDKALKNYDFLVELILKKFNHAKILPSEPNSNLESILKNANFIIIPGVKAEGIKIKIIESLMMNKIVLAHKNVVKYIGFEYDNLIVYDNNLGCILNNLDNYICNDNKKVIEDFSFTNKRQEVIEKYF